MHHNIALPRVEITFKPASEKSFLMKTILGTATTERVELNVALRFSLTCHENCANA